MRHISRLKRFFWYGTVTLLVTFAVLVTVARLTIGSVSEYRTRLEEISGKYLGQPVTIKSMDARLVGLKPSILLNEVSLREKDTREQLAHFSQIGIALNPFSSLRHLSPVIDLTIRGARIVVIQNPDGSFSLQGVTLSKQARNAERGGALGAWFLQQSRLALEDSAVIWRTVSSGNEVTFDNVNIELQNLQSRHRLNASVKLPEELGKEMRLSLDIHGDLLNRRDWAGELYLKTAQVKPGRWLKEFDYRGLRMQSGSIDLELWSTWEGGSLKRVEGAFDFSQLLLERNNRAVPVSGLEGQVRYLHDSLGWQVDLQKAVIHSGDDNPEPFRLHVQERNGVASLRARALNIRRLLRFSDQLPGLKPEQRLQLEKMAPAGQVESLRVDLKQGMLVGAVASVKDVQVSAWKKLPGVSGLDARLRLDARNAELELDSSRLVLDLPTLFEKPLNLNQVKGTVLAGRHGQGWRIASERLAVANPDLRAQLDLDLLVQPGEVPLISLEGSFQDGRVKAVPDYLPVKIMPEASAHWLKRAFTAGRVEHGSVVMHGRLEKSLMHDEQGRFEVRFNAADVAIDYKEGWPQIEAIRGEARFTGVGMAVNARSGRLYQSPIGPTHVQIRNFRHAVLDVDGTVQATAADALRFLRESPLVPGGGLEKMQAEGVTPVRLKMVIPLSSRVKEDTPLSVEGEVAFTGNRLMVAKGVVLQDVRGALGFSEKRFEADEITASLFGSPASITVYSETPDNGERGATVVAAHGHASMEALRDVVPSPIMQQIKGSGDWQARLAFTAGRSGGIDLSVHSDLNGVAVSLPEPMSKPAAGARQFDLAFGLGGARQGIYSLRYGDLLHTRWQQDSGTGRLKRIAIVLGEGQGAVLPEQDVIHVAGTLENFDWRPWRKVLQSLKAGESGDTRLPLQIRMQRLHMVESKQDETTVTDSDLSTLPPVDLAISNFSYAAINMGAISFRLKPKRRTLMLEELSVLSGTFTLTGSGQWRVGAKSQFKVNLASPNLGKMLRGLGFASVIKNGDTRFEGTVSWLGSPADFSLAALEAKGHVVIKEGTIEEVKPGAGKLLGLLSLQALPKRLFLDFSDLSKQGLQFQSIKGDMAISDGNAVTENMVLKSLPADILVTGRTGLVARDFDQLVMVVPNVSDTVSVAGALAWGPQVAAALVVLQKLFKSDIDAATMTRYKVTGTWEKPEITRLEPLPLQGREFVQPAEQAELSGDAQ